MKSEKEIIDMLAKIRKQYDKVKNENPTAEGRLASRGMALMWVLDKGKQKELTFSKNALDLLECLY